MRRFTVALALAIVVVACAGAASPQSLPDTRENRVKAAKRYLKIVPMKSLMQDAATEMAKQLPANQRAELVQLMTRKMRLGVLEEAAKNSMVKRFTAAEINALANFYGSPEGRSVMKKFGQYMADIMPVIQAEIARAVQSSQPERQ